MRRQCVTAALALFMRANDTFADRRANRVVRRAQVAGPAENRVRSMVYGET